MANEFRVVDVWIGRLSSREAAEAYFHETYAESPEDDGRPISQFAADMGEKFYDHDFMEQEFHDPPLEDIAAAVAPHSFSSSYLAGVVQAFNRDPLIPFNVVVMMCNREIENPVSVNRPDRVLRYLGRFDCDPAAPPAA